MSWGRKAPKRTAGLAGVSFYFVLFCAGFVLLAKRFGGFFFFCEISTCNSGKCYQIVYVIIISTALRHFLFYLGKRCDLVVLVNYVSTNHITIY